MSRKKNAARQLFLVALIGLFWMHVPVAIKAVEWFFWDHAITWVEAYARACHIGLFILIAMSQRPPIVANVDVAIR